MIPEAARAAREAFLYALIAGLVVLAVITTLSGVAAYGTVGLIVWVVAMGPPLLIIAAYAARRAALRADARTSAVTLAAHEAEHGPLAGRQGQLVRWRPKDGYPLPPGVQRWAFVDGDLELPVVVDDRLPPPGPVTVQAARALRPGDVPFMATGIGVVVAAADGP